MIFHASDLAVVQAYREYQVDNEALSIPKTKQLTLLHFRRRLAESLLLRNKMLICKRGRPSGSKVKPRRPRNRCPAKLGMLQLVKKINMGNYPYSQSSNDLSVISTSSQSIYSSYTLVHQSSFIL
ncbi:unnamed protein product [Pieris macdunnoughi]|uniref:Uncharacterized protein n=1 Tax=Pieris macdunnoughi TaxID=345717 RepID=A0A821UFC4_9NEOP|nr:unnamed protein product [Pieris macdunnoughi]